MPLSMSTPPALTHLDTMFSAGFLKEVYEETRIGSENISKIVTRFPPEPNGYLHLGHAKAIAINFGFAQYHGGECYLRFDDTNPGGEEERYFLAIEDIISWLGFRPVRITYSSDNFEKLYDLAEKLITKGSAYVCHCTAETMKQLRGGGKEARGGLGRSACVHRDRPVTESLDQFRAMRDGKYAKGEAVLRMKQDLTSGNPQMWDLTAYRILDPDSSHHYRTQDTWRIYPTYDFTHCICDSFQGITHSLCTTEFETSRESYNWLCKELDVYMPMQREYDAKHVRGWDDPRLYTLIALRRRGIPPGALLSFVSDLGVSKAPSVLGTKRFEQAIRKYLELSVPRLMVVLDPLQVVIENLPDAFVEMVDVPFAKDPGYGTHHVPFTEIVYIDRSDSREVDSKDYFRLAPGKAVGLLRVPFPIVATKYDKDETTGLVTKVYASYQKPGPDEQSKKPKTYIQWIGKSLEHGSPIQVEARLFKPLFDRDDPDTHPDGWLSALSEKSEEILPNAMVEIGLTEIIERAPWPAEAGEKQISSVKRPETVRFQAVRTAYFCLDKDSTSEKSVLNRIVTLKEDSGK